MLLAVGGDSVLGAGLDLLPIDPPGDRHVGDGQLALKLGRLPLLDVGVFQRNDPLPLGDRERERGGSASPRHLIEIYSTIILNKK